MAAQLARSADLYHPNFVLLLGDNFYERGVTGVADPVWQARFEGVYTGPALQIPFHATLGNHDYITPGSAAAEIAYTATGGRWRMPAAYYTFVDTIVVPADAQQTVRYVGIDTDALTRNLGAVTQLAWLDSVLAVDSSRWVIVYGHHPLYGRGQYGDTPSLHSTLRPLLERYGVDVYLAGHAHNLQVSRAIHGVTYVVSGGGAAFDRAHSLGASSPNIVFSAADGGFVALGFGSRGCILQLINRDGYKLYEVELANR